MMIKTDNPYNNSVIQTKQENISHYEVGSYY